MAEELTALLGAWRRGDSNARDRLIALVYPQLRAIAQRQLQGERAQHTLQPTALVNEAYLRLSGIDRIEWADRAHFVRFAARLMREILVDHARRVHAAKRDGGERVALTGLDVTDGGGPDASVDTVAIDAALTRLEAIDSEKARVVELRYFGGLTLEETAEAMDISLATVKRHWQAARIWLFDTLN